MNEIIICLIITFAVVYITDFLGFFNQATARVLSIIRGKEIGIDRINLPYIFRCSLCQSFWLTLIVLLVMNWKLCWISLVFSYLTKPILYLYTLIDLFVEKMYKVLYNLINKI